MYTNKSPVYPVLDVPKEFGTQEETEESCAISGGLNGGRLPTRLKVIGASLENNTAPAISKSTTKMSKKESASRVIG